MSTRKAVVVLAFALLLTSPAFADSPLIENMKVGEEGHFMHKKDEHLKFKIDEVIDKDTLLIAPLGDWQGFIVAKYPTKGLADDEPIFLEGQYKVTGTKKYNGKTYKVVEPLKPAKKDKK